MQLVVTVQSQVLFTAVLFYKLLTLKLYTVLEGVQFFLTGSVYKVICSNPFPRKHSTNRTSVLHRNYDQTHITVSKQKGQRRYNVIFKLSLIATTLWNNKIVFGKRAQLGSSRSALEYAIFYLNTFSYMSSPMLSVWKRPPFSYLGEAAVCICDFIPWDTDTDMNVIETIVLAETAITVLTA